ncbi:MAG: glycosyltransferase family 4 protein [Planctomycetota bacterium]
MRVCLFTPTFLPALGGAERMADTLARGLTGRGHEVVVLAPQPEPDAGAMPDVPYRVERYRRWPAQHLWPERLARPLKRLHRGWPFDVVLAFYSYPTGYAATRARRSLGVPVVVTPRGGDLYPNFHALRKPRVPAVIAAGYRDADRVVSISGWLTERIQQVTGRTPGELPPIDAVPNGVDLAAFDADLAAADRGTLPLGEGERFLLHLGRVTPVKRTTLAVEAVALEADRFRREKLRYAVVGDGSELSAVAALVERHRLGDVVAVLGRRTGPERAWLLRHAAGFVTTSREEGMPNAVLEAMAAGLPILASDIGPHRELVAGRGWGLLCDSTRPADWGMQMRALVESDRDAMRAAALRLRERYTLARTIDGYESSLQKAIDDFRGSNPLSG